MIIDVYVYMVFSLVTIIYIYIIYIISSRTFLQAFEACKSKSTYEHIYIYIHIREASSVSRGFHFEKVAAAALFFNIWVVALKGDFCWTLEQ